MERRRSWPGWGGSFHGRRRGRRGRDSGHKGPADLAVMPEMRGSRATAARGNSRKDFPRAENPYGDWAAAPPGRRPLPFIIRMLRGEVQRPPRALRSPRCAAAHSIPRPRMCPARPRPPLILRGLAGGNERARIPARRAAPGCRYPRAERRQTARARRPSRAALRRLLPPQPATGGPGKQTARRRRRRASGRRRSATAAKLAAGEQRGHGCAAPAAGPGLPLRPGGDSCTFGRRDRGPRSGALST